MTSDEYWNELYKSGGTSGTTTEGRSEVFRVLNENSIPMEDVVDIGCGDMYMWQGQEFRKYIGVDRSPEIIARNRQRFPKYTFELADIGGPELNVSAPTVTCFNVLFHIRDDKTFARTIENIASYSTRYVVIVTWRSNPLNEAGMRRKVLRYLWNNRRFLELLQVLFASEISDDFKYQRYRRFEDYYLVFQKKGFELQKVIPTGKYGAFYIFRKR